MSPSDGRVLVVDDDRISQTILTANLRKRGYEVELASDGREALARLKSNPFDVVLLDIIMPDIDGYEVLKAMKADEALRHIPVIVISQIDRVDSAIRCIEMGATDYLSKPFNPVLLHARLNTSLAHKKMRDMEQEYLTKIQAAHDELEQRVKERTAQLMDVNARLLGEIEERKRAEEARRAAEGELEEQRLLSLRTDRLRALGEMAAGIAHELNQPLLGVRGLAEHLLIAMDRGWNTPEYKVRERLNMILEQSDRMTHIIEHIRLFSREAGKPELHRVRIEDVIKAATNLIGEQFRARGIQLDCELAKSLPRILVNPFSLEEVILNLLINARDATEECCRKPSGCPPVQLRVFGSGDEAVPGIVIEIIDQGAGIPTEILPRVFDPFFTTKGPDKGTGLGLPISRSIVEQFGGTLRIESVPERGTVASILLPAAVEEGQ